MAITLVGSAKGTNTATAPAHAIGDLMVVVATRNASATPPSLPAGFTSLGTRVSTLYSSIAGYRVATSTADATGTWTNATETVLHIYRGSAGKLAIAGAVASGTGSATPITYPALTLLGGTTSWVACFGGVKGAATNVESPPTGTTLRQDEIGTGELASFDTNATVSSWTAVNVTLTGTVTQWNAWSIEIRDFSFAPFGLTQSAITDVAPPTTSDNKIVCTFAAAVAAGGFVWGVAGDGSSSAITSVTDDKGNTYNLGTPTAFATNIFWLGNINNAPTTITVNLAATQTFRSMMMQEWSGVSAVADPNDGHTVQAQPTPGTGANGVTPGSATTTVNGDLILGAYVNEAGTAPTVTAGTGFQKTVDNFVSGNTEIAVEAQVQTSAGSIAATWTQSIAGATDSFMLAVKAAGGVTAWAGSAALAPAAALASHAEKLIGQQTLAPAAVLSANVQKLIGQQALAPITALTVDVQKLIGQQVFAPAAALTVDALKLIGQQTFVPAAALTANALKLIGQQSLAPATTLSADALKLIGQQSLAPAAALTSTAMIWEAGVAALAPSAGLAATANLWLVSTIALAPAAALSANVQKLIGQQAFAPSAALSANAILLEVSSTALAPSTTLAVDALKLIGQQTLAPAAALSATAMIWETGVAALAPAAALTSIPNLWLVSTIALAPAAALSASVQKLIGQQAFAPATTLTSTAVLLQAGAAALTPAATLSVDMQKLLGQQTFAPAAALTSTAILLQAGAAALAPSLSLTADAKPLYLISASFGITTTLTANLFKPISASLAPSTTLAVSTVQRYAASTSLTPAASLVTKPLGPQFTLVQNAFNDVAPASTFDTTIVCSFTNPVSTGGFVWGVGYDGAGVQFASVTDDKGNVYNTGTAQDTLGNIFWLGNINNAPTTITITLTATSAFRSMAMQEWSGVAATANPSDGTTGAFQATPGTGTDAVTSGNITPSTNGDIVFGVFVSDGTGIITAGTGWTKTLDNLSITNTQIALEALTQPTAAAVAAKWKQSSASVDGTIAFVLAARPNIVTTWAIASTAAIATALVVSERLFEVASAALAPAASLSTTERLRLLASSSAAVATTLNTTGQIRQAGQATLAASAAFATDSQVYSPGVENLFPAAALTSTANLRMLAASALAPQAAAAINESMLLLARAALGPAAALNANPQTFIFDTTETFSASNALTVSTVQRMAVVLAATAQTALGVSEVQYQALVSGLVGEALLLADPRTPEAQQWLASALLGPASILSLKTTQVLAGANTTTPSTTLTANAQVYSPGVENLFPAAAIAAAATMRQVARSALVPTTALTGAGSLTIAARAVLSPAAILSAAAAVPLTTSAALAALTVLTGRAQIGYAGRAAFNPSSQVSTAAVQRLLAMAGLSGSVSLTAVSGFTRSGFARLASEAVVAAANAGLRMRMAAAISAAVSLNINDHIQPSFFIPLASTTVLTNNFKQVHRPTLHVAGNALFGGSAVQYHAAQLLLNNSSTLSVSLTRQLFAASTQMDNRAVLQSKASILVAAAAKLVPALFTDIHVSARRTRETSTTPVIGQRKMARTFARRSSTGIIGQSPDRIMTFARRSGTDGITGQSGTDRVTAKGGFENFDEG